MEMDYRQARNWMWWLRAKLYISHDEYRIFSGWPASGEITTAVDIALDYKQRMPKQWETYVVSNAKNRLLGRGALL